MVEMYVSEVTTIIATTGIRFARTNSRVVERNKLGFYT